jgi:putative ABC transport system substrate-binding protein
LSEKAGVHRGTCRGGGLAACGAGQALPVIGLLSGFSPASGAETLAAFRQGLSEAGFTEHQNIGIEYRWAEYRYEQLPAMAADLVRRQVALILTMPTAAALAAKAATTTIPVVFTIAGDPVQLGLVASLARPGGNVTGTTFYVAQLGSRQLEILHQLVPRATTIGVLVNPNQPAANVEPQVKALELAATTLGLQLRVLKVAGEFDARAAFETLARERVDALFVTTDALFSGQLRDLLVALAALHRLPAVYPWRDHVAGGGLISYASSLFDAGRHAGICAGRILNGAKPADLPVIQPTKFELVINLKTAKALGLDVPDKLLAIADEVIE